MQDGKEILDKLNDRFGIKLCNENYMLGVNRELSTTDDGVTINHLSQVAYIEDVWEQYSHYRKGRREPTRPCDDMRFIEPEGGQLVEPPEEEYEAVRNRGYRSLVGSILWPARNCYPMIQWTCVQLCRCMDKPSEAAWNSALHCLHYLYSIRDSGVRFRSDGNAIPFAMYDSGHLQDRIDYKSFYGYIIVWMGAPILWTCKKHQHVGESSSEDEFMALNHVYKAVKWIRSLFNEIGLGHLVSDPTVTLGDNVQAGRWATEDMITVGNRFIERMYFKVREGVENGDVDPRYINTKLNVSDVLTKGVNREIVRVMQAIFAGDAPWPDIPDAETALQNQVAYLQGFDLPV